MALTLFKFETSGPPEGAKYTFEIEWDAVASLDDRASFEIRAVRTHPDHEDPIEVQANATVDFGRNTISVSVEDRLSFEIPLDHEGIAAAEDKDFSGGDEGALWTAIESAVDDDSPLAARLIDAVPVPDPFFGCMLRAGLSTFVGQAIKCAPEAGDGGMMSRASRLLRCLRRNGIRMMVRTAVRTARCWVLAGAPDFGP